MLKKIIFLFLIITTLSFAINDIAADKDYKGFRKITDHSLENYYDIYFKINNILGGTSTQIKVIPIYKQRESEKIKLSLQNGEFETKSRKEWFEYFRTNSTKTSYFKETYPDLFEEYTITETLYEDYLKPDYEKTAYKIAEKYINEKYK